MKKFISLFIIVSISSLIYAQDCKVLIEDLKGEYIGECKKGLAHGKGEAKGKDTYIGTFKKGYPNGEGKYIYNPGDKIHDGNWKKGKKEGYGVYTVFTDSDSIVKEGYWRDDEYYGRYETPYKIVTRREISKVMIVKKGEGNTIEFRFLKQGQENNNIRAIILDSKNGFKNVVPETSASFTNCTFPFTGKIEYATTGVGFSPDPQAATYCELVFEIYEPGHWEIVISN